MAKAGQKTEEVYRRYAVVDEAIIREAVVRWTEERRCGELLHSAHPGQDNRPEFDEFRPVFAYEP
jgi:hypothetical protein